MNQDINVLEENMKKLLAFYHLPNEEAVDTLIESIRIIDSSPETIPCGPGKRKTCLFLADCLRNVGKSGNEEVSFDNDMLTDAWGFFGKEILIDVFHNPETKHKTLAKLLLNKDVKFSVKLLSDH